MTVFELYCRCRDALSTAEVCDFSLEAQLLLCHCLDMTKTEFLLQKSRNVEPETVKKVETLIERRRLGEPLQYIIGEWDFYGETFKVGEGVLIPRPETEELCTLVVERLKGKNSPTVFDLCAGSGCIGITLKKQIPDANVYLVEYYDKALFYLNENRKRLGVARTIPAIKGDVLRGFEAFGFLPRPDVIVSNPPYIQSSELSLLQKEVRREPQTALDGGEDGLEFYRVLSEEWLPFINDGGFLAVECGEEQADAIASMFSEHCNSITIEKDLNGIDRFVIAGKG